MPTIGNLFSRRQRDVYRLRVGARSIPGNDLDGGVVLQPCDDRLRLPASEDFNWLASLQIDDDGSVVVTASDCPIVNADYPRL